MNAISASAAPARHAIASPPPVEAAGFVVSRHSAPDPPVARTVARALMIWSPWRGWCVIAPREQDGPGVAEAAALAKRAVKALGLASGMTHMEWFRRADGTLAIGEIAARPPGANIVRLTGLAHDTSMYRAWARAVVDDAFDGPWERRYAAGSAFLRGMGRGRVLGTEGVDALQRAVGQHVVEAKLPTVGMPKSDSYEGDGYVIVRHPDTEVVREAMKVVIANARVRYA